MMKWHSVLPVEDMPDEKVSMYESIRQLQCISDSQRSLLSRSHSRPYGSIDLLSLPSAGL